MYLDLDFVWWMLFILIQVKNEKRIYWIHHAKSESELYIRNLQTHIFKKVLQYKIDV
jgi:hypothetical protein